jgi:hypothetical protein
MKPTLLIICLFLFFISCSQPATQELVIPQAPDYSMTTYWYLDPAGQTTKAADIFYVYPTLGSSSTNEEGHVLYFTDVSQQHERDAALGNQRFNHQVYAGVDYNFFAPFYRQRTMDAYQAEPVLMAQHRNIPVEDIAAAFGYYMANYNLGRPFMLLGHSQGSAVLLELLKHHITAEQLELMVAAYLIGWQITAEELEHFPDRIRPATGSDDTGVIIMYNSLTTLDAKSPVIGESVVCINPLNWKTDGTPAGRESHMGILRYNREKGQYDTIPHFTGAYIAEHYLICPDVDPAMVYNEALAEMFPFGNLHFMDSWLFALNLKDNMALRLAR